MRSDLRFLGAQRGNRTLDLFITSEMLCRLSYLGGDPEIVATLRGRATAVLRPDAAWDAVLVSVESMKH